MRAAKNTNEGNRAAGADKPAAMDARPSEAGPPTASGKLQAPPASSDAVRKSMKGNRRCDTKPELAMRRRLREAGLTGYRLQWKVPGRPDIAWPGKKVALFVNGCSHR